MSTTRLANTPLVLIIRDGWGENPHAEHDAFNAVKLAHAPVDDRLRKQWPNTLIITCGEDVGLPPGTMGNSEVGHQNIGAGRIVDQELMRITRSIRDGSFFRNRAFHAAIEHAKTAGGKLHLLGLLSNGYVHSDIEHLFALIDLAERERFPGDRTFVHVITDGRDVGPTTGLGFVRQLEAKLAPHGNAGPRRGRIASVCGRYYAMDRDNRWERVAQAWAMLTDRWIQHPLVPATWRPHTATSAAQAVQRYYDHPSESSRRGDEFIVPTQIVDSQSQRPIGVVDDNDAVIFFNFRGDRPRELTKAFVLDEESWKKVPNAVPVAGGAGGGIARAFGGFLRSGAVRHKLHGHNDCDPARSASGAGPPRNVFFCTMTGYEAGLKVSAVAFDKPPKMPNILGELISEAALTQFRCAETEKFPHVTFFFNDYREQPFAGERRELIPSPRDVTTYDQKPQMSAPGVCDAVLRRLSAPDCEPLIIVNFANPDMVGHTGNLQAAIKAVEVVDECVGKIVDATLKRNGSLIITADHGNAEQMWDPTTNSPHTAHTVYDVPLIIVGERFAMSDFKLRSGGRLADIAPTILAMMGINQPPEMTGQSLLVPARSLAASGPQVPLSLREGVEGVL
jgi:2,3-bisphosphoglycerate-independent phosphoglycerate mutase